MDVSHIVVVVAVLTIVVAGRGSGWKVDAGGREPARVVVDVDEQQEHELPQCLFHPPLLPLPLLLPSLEHLHSPPPQVLFPAGPSKPRLDQPLSSHSSPPPLPVPQVAWTRTAPKSMLMAYCDSFMVVVGGGRW